MRNVKVEKTIMEIGNIAKSKVWDSPTAYRVYDPNGLSPTLVSNPAGGARQPIIIINCIFEKGASCNNGIQN